MAEVFTHIGEILARNARMYPDDVALIERIPAEKKRFEITWKQFDDQANQFSNALAKMGVKKGDKVVHFMNNSMQWLVAYFGIIRTGAWVVPLNFRFTAEDVKYCSDVAQPKVVVFDEEFTDRIEAIKDQLPTVKNYICVGAKTPAFAESYEKLLAGAPATNLNVTLLPTDECGLYFTSGTTGQPKPILLTHNNMFCACVTENMHH
ncbi:MAG TPA: AMP-binding protein, partial [Syntrophorhabdaceae bacterium]|nr:AMP-binding protein [Syntrophorhabdaceae bacterium]